MAALGGSAPGGCLLRGLSAPGGMSALAGLVLGGCLLLVGCLVLVTPPGTATAAGGTHPTGMHSCINFKYYDLAIKMVFKVSLCLLREK